MEVESLWLEEAAKTVCFREYSQHFSWRRRVRNQKTKLQLSAVPLRQEGITPQLKGKKMHLWKVVQKVKRGRGEGKKTTRQYIFGIQTVTAVRAVFPKDEKVFICAKLEQCVYIYLISCGCCTALCNSVV